MSLKKIEPDWFSRFDIYRIQKNKQTNKQTDKPNLYIDYLKFRQSHKIHGINGRKERLKNG